MIKYSCSGTTRTTFLSDNSSFFKRVSFLASTFIFTANPTTNLISSSMKAIHVLGVLFFFLGSCCLFSCDKNSPDSSITTKNKNSTDSPVFLFDENGVCYSPSAASIPKNTVLNTILHAGWKYVSTYKINPDGSYSNQDYYENMLGGSPSYFYFEDESSLKEYIYADAIPALGFYPSSYQINEKNRLMTNFHVDMQILSVSQNEIKVIEYLAVRYNGEKVYGYTTYQRMSEEELAEVQKKYTTDLSQPTEPDFPRP